MRTGISKLLPIIGCRVGVGEEDKEERRCDCKAKRKGKEDLKGQYVKFHLMNLKSIFF